MKRSNELKDVYLMPRKPFFTGANGEIPGENPE